MLVLMSPEHAVTPPWRRLFGSEYYKRHLAVVAIDEAHCIVDWWGKTCMLECWYCVGELISEVLA